MPISLYTTQELLREAQQPAEGMSVRLRRCCDAHTPPGAKLESCFWRGGFRLFVVYRLPGLKKSNFHEIKGSSFSNQHAAIHETIVAAYAGLARKSMFADIFSNDRPTTAWKGAVIPGMGKRVPGFKMEGDQPRHDEEITKIYHVGSEIVFPKSTRPTPETQARIDKMLAHGRKAMQDKMDQLVVEALIGATIVQPTLNEITQDGEPYDLLVKREPTDWSRGGVYHAGGPATMRENEVAVILSPPMFLCPACGDDEPIENATVLDGKMVCTECAAQLKELDTEFP